MCDHISEYHNNYGMKPYKVVNMYFGSCPTQHTRRTKSLNCFCFVCASTTHLFGCLQCMYFGCRAHINEHFKKQEHYAYQNLSHGHVFCCYCNDFVYDHRFIKVHEKNQYKAAKSLKKSVSHQPWFPTDTEIALLQQHQRKLLTENNRIGLRGLFNLGSTCFMNCIIQVLIHTPVLRDYFLSNRHSCKLESCMVCETSKIFQEFYSGKTYSPISLHDLLFMIWKNASHLAGYKQQDAHEFFIASLNLLHLHFRDSAKTQTDPCCIVDEIFTGESELLPFLMIHYL
jgi:ubiquitin carboxyl-terminal hydrolase 22/27/51